MSNEMNTKIQEAINSVVPEWQRTEITFSIWKDSRIYVNKPNESAQYKSVGYVSLSNKTAYPACGDKVRTSRDRDAVEILNAIANAI